MATVDSPDCNRKSSSTVKAVASTTSTSSHIKHTTSTSSHSKHTTTSKPAPIKTTTSKSPSVAQQTSTRSRRSRPHKTGTSKKPASTANNSHNSCGNNQVHSCCTSKGGVLGLNCVPLLDLLGNNCGQLSAQCCEADQNVCVGFSTIACSNGSGFDQYQRSVRCSSVVDAKRTGSEMHLLVEGFL